MDNDDRDITDRANILLVDDLPEKLLVLETILAELGQNIMTARSGEEALRKVLEYDFAVILLDIHLPGMDGLETAAFIRRRKRSAHTPIIFMTAYADEVHSALGYRLGAVDYIFSPVVPDVLRTKVKVFVELHLMTQQVRRQADERVALAQEQAARAAAEDATRRFAFLAQAGTALSSTLDYAATLRALAQHLVPALADLGAAQPVDELGRPGAAELSWISGAGVIHTTTAEDNALAGMADATARCLETGRLLHLSDAGPWPTLPAHAVAINGTPAAATPARDVRLRSVAIVPLTARGRTLGVMTLALGPSGRTHSPADLALATDLAARAAIALDNARLYQNIQQEDERKNQFLAMLAHELRNPLAPIRNAVHVIKLVGTEDATLVQARDMIDRQVAHMARLVDDLLDMSRLARGKIYLRKERLDLTQIVRDTIADYRSLLAESGLELRLGLPEGPLYVEGDATRLAQVLGNVLHNASKFTDRGGVVTVRLAEETKSQGAKEPSNHGAAGAADVSPAVLLTVRDTGIGMDRAMLERVFDTFSQADSSLDRSRGGLGLGLALVRGLVQLHGGEVSAVSGGPGQGTEIAIRLPLGTAMPLAESRRVAVDPPRTIRRVLVIEDSLDTAESMRMLFALTGHLVQVAHTGPAGLETARAFRPHVVVCDIGLPGGMDGYAVARAIRRDPALTGMRLIAVSGYGQDEDRRRSREAGFDLHLIKPVDFGELCRLLSIPAPVPHDALR